MLGRWLVIFSLLISSACYAQRQQAARELASAHSLHLELRGDTMSVTK